MNENIFKDAMPFTPYHFGPAGLLGLPFYKRMDFPLFMLANVAVDVEVLVDMKFFPGLPVHGYAHTLLGATGVGILLASLAFPLRGVFRRMMNFFGLDYKPAFAKMIFGAVLGAIFHVVIDAFCWYDVGLLWPWRRYNRIYSLLGPDSVMKVRFFCLICYVLAFIVYLIMILMKKKNYKNI